MKWVNRLAAIANVLIENKWEKRWMPEDKVTNLPRRIFQWNKVDLTFNLLTCRQKMSKAFLLYWHVVFILIVSLHSKAGLTAILNQYWRSKALVLYVYRSTPSAGLCFLCTFWSLSVCCRRDWRNAIYAAFNLSSEDMQNAALPQMIFGHKVSTNYANCYYSYLFQYLCMCVILFLLYSNSHDGVENIMIMSVSQYYTLSTRVSDVNSIQLYLVKSSTKLALSFKEALCLSKQLLELMSTTLKVSTMQIVALNIESGFLHTKRPWDFI